MMASSEGVDFTSLRELLPNDGTDVQGTVMLDNMKYAYYGITDPDTGYKYMALFDMEAITKRVTDVVYFSVWVALATLLLGLIYAFAEAKKSYAPIHDIAKRLLVYQNRERVNEYSSIKEALDDLQQENSKFRARIEDYLPVMKNNMLCHLLMPNGDEEMSGRDLRAYNIEFLHKCFHVAILQMEVMDTMGSLDEHTGDNQFSSLGVNAFFKYYIEDFLNTDEDTCYLVEKQDGNLAIILNTEHQQPSYFEERFTCLFSELRRMLGNTAEIITLVGLSNMHEDAQELPAAHAEALSAVEYRHMKIKSDLIWYEDIKKNTRIQYQFTFEQEQKIINLLKTGNQENCEQYVNILLDRYFTQGRMKREDGLYIFKEILSTCIKVMVEIKGFEGYTISFYKLASFVKFDDMNAYVLRSIAQVCETVRESQQPRSDRLENSIIEWIDRNYTNNEITLTFLSEQFNISSSYVSRLIKDHLGINFVEYLNKCRIAKAKELLKDETILVKDIAVLVGYDCDKNFRRVFKKYEGITPGEFRNQL